MKVPMVGDRTVLVTGCSSGIGLATAEVLRSRGWKVFPTARKVADLDALRQAGFDAIKLDVASSESIKVAVKIV